MQLTNQKMILVEQNMILIEQNIIIKANQATDYIDRVYHYTNPNEPHGNHYEAARDF